MGDDAQACPRCKSLMVSGEDTRHQHALPRWLHPLVVMVFLIAASGALLAVDLKPWGKGKTSAPITGEPGAMPTASSSAAGAGAIQPAPAAAADPAANLYKEVNDYVASVNDTLAQTDAVAAELDKLAKRNDPAQVTAMRDKQSQLQHFTNRLRSLTPPVALASAHTRLCNSQAVRGRAYRSLALFMQSGDTKRLDRATHDLDTAQKSKEQAMAEIIAYRDKIPAPGRRARHSAAGNAPGRSATPAARRRAPA